MKVVADDKIPFLKGVLEPYAQVTYLPGGEIGPADVKDADALLVRTRTRCDASLLADSGVKFVGTATIGTDHLDLQYLTESGITAVSAPGCNSGGVMQYVITSLFSVAKRKGLDLRGTTLGVIGCGHTGGRVADIAARLGFRVLRNDPPKAALDSVPGRYVTLEHLLRESDIVTCHVPLDCTTCGMADTSFFETMKPGAVFINASRGEVVVNDALAAKVASGTLSGLILDVWDGEPDHIDRSLVKVADIATPHIAGYSYEGKLNGTSMVVQALARHSGITELVDFEPEHTPGPELELPEGLIYDNHFHSGVGREGCPEAQRRFADVLERIFPVMELDSQMRAHPENFEKIRGGYDYRREFRY